MAGGEGTRLRPLTSNQPKPMVPIVGKPCMEHIVELLRDHGFDEVVVTLAFMPQAIRSYFGDGEALGVKIEYSVEDTPLGTAGSVKQAEGALQETFLVISGDALCDVDLGALLDFHREKKAAVTIGLKSVDNPLEFGIVVTDEDGRIERFLEKPSWSQVFSDTINTGIYVMEPEVLRHIPAGEQYDFSSQLFPLLLEMGRPLYGFVLDGYWQDIGNLDQYRQANFDALEEKVRLNVPGIRLRGNVWVGEGVEIDDLSGIEGPAFVGNYSRIGSEAVVGEYAVLGSSVTLREGARVTRTVIDSSTHIGRASVLEGAILGRSCDIRSHVHVNEGVAIGDEVTIGAESVVMPDVRIYPYKEVESGSQIFESLIWESRASTRLFGKESVSGLVNVDLTPEVAVRLASALGTALKRGARVIASRESPAACRMVKRAMISGLNSTGIDVSDLRVLPAAVNRHLLKTDSYDAGIHVGTNLDATRRSSRSASSSRPGSSSPRACRRRSRSTSRARSCAARPPATSARSPTRRAFARATPTIFSARSTRRRSAPAASGSSSTTATPRPRSSSRSSSARSASRRSRRTASPPTGPGEAQDVAEALEQSQRLVSAASADFGAVFDRAGERLYLDRRARARRSRRRRRCSSSCACSRAHGRKGKLAFPVTVTSQVERIVAGTELEVVRTRASLADLTAAAAEPGVVFARLGRRRLRLPRVPARLRRGRERVQAPRAPRADRAAALRSSSPRCRARRFSTRSSPARGRRRGWSCAS